MARGRAEEQVKALEVTDEFGLHLAELTLQVPPFVLLLHILSTLEITQLLLFPAITLFAPQRDGALPVRQLASVLLKQYIDVHWSPDAARCARRKSQFPPKM